MPRIGEHEARIGVRMPREERMRLRRAAQNTRMTESAFVREAVSAYIDVLPPHLQPPKATAPRRRPGS